MTKYVICITNQGYPASLEVRKLYRQVPDRDAEALGQIRVVDESGEDYLYAAEMFAPVDLPKEVERAVSEAV